MDTLDLLLVEDSPEDAHLITRVLDKETPGLRLHWLRDGEEALTYLIDDDAPKPKVIFLDIKLPKIGGLEVLERVKSHATLKSIPVVIYSSSYQPSDIKRAYELGANSYLLKPESYKELKELLLQFYLYWFSLNKDVRSLTKE